MSIPAIVHVSTCLPWSFISQPMRPKTAPANRKMYRSMGIQKEARMVAGLA